MDVAHQGHVDLDHVGLELREAGQAGIAGAEVVDRDAKAAGLRAKMRACTSLTVGNEVRSVTSRMTRFALRGRRGW